MPRKRKAAAGKGGAGGKKAKKVVEVEEEEEEAPVTVSDAIQKLKTADKGKKKRSAKPDAMCSVGGSCEVFEDYDCMLNQTNIGHNNNKYYVIQVLRDTNKPSRFYTWNRWGRVGESGQNSLNACGEAAAVAAFKKKFKDKTKHKWDDRDNFIASPGKYTLLEMDDDDDDDDLEATKEKLAKLDEIDGVKREITTTADCTLDKSTKDLMKLIFDNDMFNDAMKALELDIKKMPLGKLSKSQIAKGFEVLEEMEEVIKKKKRGNLTELSSRFYTIVPHDFGRQRPPVMNHDEHVRKKKDMLMVLADIELAQSMQKNKPPSITKDTKVEPHPYDINYELLQADLDVLDKKGKEFKVLEKYLNETKNQGGYKSPVIQDIWKVNRHNESDKFLAHDKLDNRKLLWHGTNVAVVAAILKSGLRIMPHSGGRVGKGIYFASENSKSAGYVSCAAGGIGIMFLNEVALGKEHHIMMDDWHLTTPPKGYDSIIAKGHTEPDSKFDTTIELDGKKITVPQSKPINQPKFSSSNFSQSEYLIYKESQNRIRYMLKLHM